MAQFDRFFAPTVRRMWPGAAHGVDNLPAHDDFMIVANHSGVGSAELLSLMTWWHDGFGVNRSIAAMAHPAGFRVRPFRYFLDGVGAVEATEAGAAWARRHRAPLLVFPGGDHESMRPLWKARRVDFGGRTGWIRLAREWGLDVVPLCITGSHRTNPVLMGGRSVAWLTGMRALGMRRAPLTLLGVLSSAAAYGALRTVGRGRMLSGTVALSALWTTFMIPWIPAKIGFHFLPPIPRSDLTASDHEIYDQVVGRLQAVMDS